MTPAELVIQALRSGRFTQGKRYLNRHGNLCCLGVACEVAIENGVNVRRVERDGVVMYGKAEQRSVLPDEVQDWLGLATKGGDYGDGEAALTDDNDTCGHSFGRIADTIESRPEGLFR